MLAGEYSVHSSWAFSNECQKYVEQINGLSRTLSNIKAVVQRCSIKKGVPRNFVKFTGKHMCQSLFFNKVAYLRPPTLLKKRLWHRRFPVNFAKILRIPFFIEQPLVTASETSKMWLFCENNGF